MQLMWFSICAVIMSYDMMRDEEEEEEEEREEEEGGHSLQTAS